MLNLSTQELLRFRLKLKDDVRVVPQRSDGEVSYQFQSRSQGRFFSVGRAEFLFCSLLDGEASISEALTLSAPVLGVDAFAEHEAVAICGWLIDTGLAEPLTPQGTTAGVAREAKSTWSLNPFWTRVPLLRPDSLIRRLLPALGWLYSPMAVWLVGALWVWSVIVLVGRWHEFSAASHQLFAPQNWLWMGLIWIGLKVVHESGHALACRRHGGEVREMGLVFILFAPLAYVDVTSSWSFPSRWKRMQVAFGGMYLELILAACALLGWSRVESPEARFLLYNVVVMAGVTTLLFNANPLMRFDGYYILSDLLGMPNLYAKGSNALSDWLKWLTFGHRATRNERGWIGVLLLVYGVATTVWKFLVTASLLVAASVLFEGAGLVLAAFGTGLFVLVPLRHWGQVWWTEWRRNPWRTLRAALGIVTIGGALAAAVFLMPCPGGAFAPGIVEYRDLLVIRSGADGFISQIHVESGDYVEAGTLLAEIENADLNLEVRDLQLAIEQSQSRQRGFLNQSEIGTAQIEARHEHALQERLRDRQEQLDRLQVRAPQSGRVLGERLHERLGTYVKSGTELFALGHDDSKEVLISVRQDALESAQATLRTQRRVQIAGRGRLHGEVDRLNPRASLHAPHQALYAPNGGALPVVIRREAETEETEYQLTEPRFQLNVQLNPEDSRQVQAGQRASLQLGYGERSIAQVLYQTFTRWLRDRLRA